MASDHVGALNTAMSLHLIKLCVGADSIADLGAWQAARRKEWGEVRHVTRMVPKRADELLDGGSIYWVIKGEVQVRQRLVEIRPFTDDEGIKRCALVLDPDLVETECVPRGPFQGWRYFPVKDAPPDLAAGDVQDLPPALRKELRALGLL
jgi:hypothetical protein